MERVARVALLLAGAALVGMAVVQGWQVIARYLLDAPTSWTEPVATVLLNFAMMLGAAAGVQSEAHFGFFIGVQAAPPPLQRVLLALKRLVIAGLGGAMAVWGTQLAMDGWAVRLAGAPLPQGILYLPTALGGTLMFVFAVGQLLGAAAPAAAGSER
jgi:TRAP-type C4-dicarboxylate transport system permease small subunit